MSNQDPRETDVFKYWFRGGEVSLKLFNNLFALPFLIVLLSTSIITIPLGRYLFKHDAGGGFLSLAVILGLCLCFLANTLGREVSITRRSLTVRRSGKQLLRLPWDEFASKQRVGWHRYKITDAKGTSSILNLRMHCFSQSGESLLVRELVRFLASDGSRLPKVPTPVSTFFGVPYKYSGAVWPCVAYLTWAAVGHLVLVAYFSRSILKALRNPYFSVDPQVSNITFTVIGVIAVLAIYGPPFLSLYRVLTYRNIRITFEDHEILVTSPQKKMVFPYSPESEKSYGLDKILPFQQHSYFTNNDGQVFLLDRRYLVKADS